MLKPSQRAGILGVVTPQSATTVQSTAWVDASLWGNLLGTVSLGVISATGTVDAKLQQATDNAGAGAKDITGKAITQLTQAGGGSGKQAEINLKPDELDINNGFKYVRLSITPATAAALITGTLLGFDARYGPADTGDAATVVEIIN